MTTMNATAPTARISIPKGPDELERVVVEEVLVAAVVLVKLVDPAGEELPLPGPCPCDVVAEEEIDVTDELEVEPMLATGVRVKSVGLVPS